MIIKFDEFVFKVNSRTEVKDENDNLICFGIYDFSYKHRRRCYINDNEIFYSQLNIENSEVVVADSFDNIYFKVIDNKASNGYTLQGDIYNWDFKVLDDNSNVVMKSVDKYLLEVNIDSIEAIKFIFAFSRFKN